MAIAITGNTYPVKDAIKALGGKWSPDQKCWMVPEAKADEARKLVAGSASAPKSTGSTYHPRKCIACSHVERRDSRGYPIGDRILKSGECQSCYEERKMGY